MSVNLQFSISHFGSADLVTVYQKEGTLVITVSYRSIVSFVFNKCFIKCSGHAFFFSNSSQINLKTRFFLKKKQKKHIYKSKIH